MKRYKFIVLGLVFLLIVASFPTITFSAMRDEENLSKDNRLSGAGTPEDPYMICDVDDLQEMNNDLSAHYALANDIDASETSIWNGGDGFEPIGDDEDNSFTGSLDGDGYSITGLYINRMFTNHVGLFGHIDGGTVENVGLIENNITGSSHVGGLVGEIREGIVSNSYATGSVSGIGTFVGGLVGENDFDSTVKNSYATGNVSGTDNFVGGLVGRGWSGTISDSYATGNVSGDWLVGGLVGANIGTVSNSYATGDVSGDEYVGGLVGSNAGDVNTSYSTGNVSGNKNVGGLVGENDIGSTVENSYAMGNVTRKSGSTETSFGGFVGFNSGQIINCYSTGSVEVEDGDELTENGFVGEVDEGSWNYEMIGNFWDVETSGQDDTEGNATGLTTSEMMTNSTYIEEDWDLFVVADTDERNTGYIWNMVDTETYPFLSWEDVMCEQVYIVIYTWEDLNKIRDDLTGNYRLMSNLTSECEGYDKYASENANDGAGWLPIGDDEESFIGEFDGNGFTISDVYIDRDTTNSIGLFGVIGEEGSVHDLNIVDVERINGYLFVGALTGTNQGTISNSSATGEVEGRTYVGGLVGINHGNVTRSDAEVDVLVSGTRAGGLVGTNHGTISDSFSLGNVTGDWWSHQLGGLVGQSSGTVENSHYNIETVSI